ncbi:unnamed protein product, partial [Pocillopora meandrina]
LVQHHEQVGKAFQEVQTQKKALAADLEGNKPRNRGAEQQCPGTRPPCENQGKNEGARDEKKRTRGPTRKEGKRKNWHIPT